MGGATRVTTVTSTNDELYFGAGPAAGEYPARWSGCRPV